MSFELKEVLQFQLGSTRKPKWEVKDLNGNTDFDIDSSTYILKNSAGTSVLNGSCTVNNSDEDVSGNTIKTIQPTLSFSGTGIATGFYTLALRIYLDNGEDDTMKINLEVVDY
jgi:hypothetical protein